MELLKIKAYPFKELSSAARERAKHDYFANFGYTSEQEAMASLEAFAAHFGSKLIDYDVSWDGSSYSSAKFADVEQDGDVNEEWLSALVAVLKHDGFCQFTGVCHDDDCNEGAVKAYNAGVREVQDLLEAGFRSWLKACQADYAAQWEDGYFSETCEANEWLFYENGDVVSPRDLA